VTTLHRDKLKKRKEKQDQRHQAHLAEKAKREALQQNKVRQLKKEFYRDIGKVKTQKNKRASKAK